ncbi:hypothetical protein BGM19_38930 [Streptomyces agglomeratus]|uniref:hypothetical protein n=1 Tax=Streptomyces agglomeratus TaxID=285458 RepID=UPI00086B7081|nr:hypothetical protein [Streptomyces agglomeratus]OEJ56612.1 hypothetical protein BGM19_38930 [Streptomyces agglomeratus]
MTYETGPSGRIHPVAPTMPPQTHPVDRTAVRGRGSDNSAAGVTAANAEDIGRDLGKLIDDIINLF